MRLRIFVPSGIKTDAQAAKVVAEGENGYFCLLPRHIDYVSSLVPGILTYETQEGEEKFAAVDEGILVKKGKDVYISCTNAVIGKRLESLRDIVQNDFIQKDEREKKTKSVLSKLEIDTMRRFAKLGENR